MTARVWSETVPLARLRDDAVMALLARHGVELIAAVRPGETDDARRLVEACDARGVRVALWPMLDDAAGRWASAATVEPYCAFVRALETACSPGEIAVDLEPPIGFVSRFAGHRRVGGGRLRDGDRDDARARFAQLVDGLHARGVRASAAVLPVVLFDRAYAGRTRGWQRLLGVPSDGVAWDHASVMLYTSMLEHWSAGFVDRRDAAALLGALCQRAVARFGADVAGASLGAVGTGALGDEPVYRSPRELAEDVAVARAAGVRVLTLFDLGGVLARPPSDAWLEALTQTRPAPRVPPPSWRVRSLLALGALSASALRRSSARRRGPRA